MNGLRAMKRKSSVVTYVSLVVLISVLATTSAIATPGDAVWVETFDGAAGLQDRGVDMEMSPDGSRVFVTGTTVVTGRRRDYITLAYDGTTGVKLWEATLGRSQGDWARSIAVSPDGVSVFVTGITTGVEGVHSWTTVAYDAATGTRLWTSRYYSPDVSPVTFGAGAQPTAVFAAGGSVYVVGNLEVPSTLPRLPALVIAYEASDGSQRWLRRYSFRPYDGATAGAIVRSAAMAPGGESVYLAIQVDETPTQNSAGVLAIDTENGDRRWRANYLDPQGAEAAHADSIAVSPDGQQVYVGTSFNFVPRRLLVFGSTDGQLLWEGNLSTSGFGEVADLAVSADGGKVFGTGSLDSGLWTWAIDAGNGNVLWEHEFHRQRGDSTQGASAVAISGGGHVVVTGQSSRIVCPQIMDCALASDIITIAYDAATGSRLWRALRGDRRVDALDVGKDIVVHPDGSSALVSGWTTQSGSPSDIVTIAYEL